ncbi:high-potential iron-sulfur protein [Dyadobacter endophyticus]|uniref:high-potential iron-sulfur protein n=1 Tax=Dyadobacter endophyticus TaxID=1749036 RepID=UPI003CF91C2B
MNNLANRRMFLRQWLALSGVVTLAGCAGSKKAPVAQSGASKNTPATDPCSDLTNVDPVDVQKRKSLGYTNKSPLPDSQCDNCKLWVPVKEGQECGGCLLFTGPVNPAGHCTYWAPQV